MTGDFIAAGPHVAIVASGEFGLSDRLDGHAYLLRTVGGGVLLDTGAGRSPGTVCRNLEAAGCSARRLEAVLLTHAHADHAGGAGSIMPRVQGPLRTSRAEAALLSDGDEESLGLNAARLTGTYPVDYAMQRADAQPVADGEVLHFGDLDVEALITPGHSVASVVWHARWRDYSALFSGDTIFRGGSTSILNVPGSSASRLRGSMARLGERSFDGLFPGHGPFRVRGGPEDVSLAVARMKASVIPNRAVPAYQPSERIWTATGRQSEATE